MDLGSDDSFGDSDFKPQPGDDRCSSSEELVKRKKSSKKKVKKKTKQDKSRPAVQSSQFWDTSDVVIDEDQPTDRKFSDPFLFVTEDGKMTRTKHTALSKQHEKVNFSLIYSKTSHSDKFVAGCSKSTKADPISIFYTVSKVPRPSKKSKVEFDALMWVQSEIVEDIPLDPWYSLLEIYQNTNVNLPKYLPSKSGSTSSANVEVMNAGVVGGPTENSECRVAPSENTDGQSNVPNQNLLNNEMTGSGTNAPVENLDSRRSPAPPENSASRSKGVPVQISGSSQDGTSSAESNSKQKCSKFNFKRVGTAPDKFIKEKESKNTVRNTATVERLFSSFLKEVHPENPTDIMNVDEAHLPNLVAEFFMMLQKNEEEKYNESTLKTYFYSLSRLMMEKRKIVLKNNPVFEETRKVLGAQQKISRENGEIPGKHASRAIPPDVLAHCWDKGVFGKQTPRSLGAAIVLNVQIMFGTRAREELAKITVGDLIPAPPRPDGLPQYYEFSERLTKTRTGANGQGARESIPRMYPDDIRPERCPVRLFEFYQSKKPAEALKPDSRLFLNALNITLRKWEDCKIWYSSQPMGHNTLGSLVRKQMEAAGVDTKVLKLTGTSVRKTGIDGSMSSGIPGSYVSMMYGQKNLASKVSYMSPTDSTQKATNLVLQNVVNGELNSSPLFKEIYDKERKANVKVDESNIAPPPSSHIDELSNDVPNEASGSPKEKIVEKKKKKKRKHKKAESSSSSSSSSECSSTDSEDEKKKIKQLKAKIKKLERKKIREPCQNAAPPTAYQVPVQILPQQFLQYPAIPQQMPQYHSVPQQMPQYQMFPQLLPNYQMLPQQFPQYQLVPGNQMNQTIQPQQQVLTRTITQTQTVAKENNNFIIDEIDN